MGHAHGYHLRHRPEQHAARRHRQRCADLRLFAGCRHCPQPPAHRPCRRSLPPATPPTTPQPRTLSSLSSSRPRQRSPGLRRRAITYGTSLSSTQLDATASVAGTFAYSPAAGTVLKRRYADPVGDLHAHRYHRLRHDDRQRAAFGEPGHTDDYLGYASDHHVWHCPEQHAARCHRQRARHLRLFASRGYCARRRHADPCRHVHAHRYHRLHHRLGQRASTVNQATPILTWTTPHPSPMARH